MSVAMPDVIEDIEVGTFEEIQGDKPWTVVVSNDPVNLVNVVQAVFQKVLKIDEATALKYTMKVHNEGKCTVYWGSQEECQSKAEELMSYQLWTHVEKA